MCLHTGLIILQHMHKLQAAGLMALRSLDGTASERGSDVQVNVRTAFAVPHQKHRGWRWSAGFAQCWDLAHSSGTSLTVLPSGGNRYMHGTI